MLSELTLCLFILNATGGYDFDCSFRIHLLDNTAYHIAEQDAELNKRTVGFIDYNTRNIYINIMFQRNYDAFGLNVWQHEIQHARLYLIWAAAGYPGECPCRFHD